MQLPLKQQHVHPFVILDLIDQLQKLEKTEHGVEAEAERQASILAIYFLVDAKLHESIIVNRPPNNDYLLHCKCLRSDLDLAKLVLNLLDHLLPHLLRQLLVQANLVQILHRKRILLRKNTLIEVRRPNLECLLQEVNRYEPGLQLRLLLLGNLEQHFILVDRQHEVLLQHLTWLYHREFLVGKRMVASVHLRRLFVGHLRLHLSLSRHVQIVE